MGILNNNNNNINHPIQEMDQNEATRLVEYTAALTNSFSVLRPPGSAVSSLPVRCCLQWTKDEEGWGRLTSRYLGNNIDKQNTVLIHIQFHGRIQIKHKHIQF